MIGWRAALAILGFLLLAGCLFDAKSGATSAFGTLWYECLAAGFVLIIPFVYENDRQERLVREAQKRWKAEHPDWKAEAKRNGIYPSWSNVFLAISAAPASLAGALIGVILVGNAASVSLGFVLLVALPTWAMIRERRCRKAVPKGVIGQADDGVYVYGIPEEDQPVGPWDSFLDFLRNRQMFLQIRQKFRQMLWLDPLPPRPLPVPWAVFGWIWRNKTAVIILAVVFGFFAATAVTNPPGSDKVSWQQAPVVAVDPPHPSLTTIDEKPAPKSSQVDRVRGPVLDWNV